MIDDHNHFLALHGYQGERPLEMACAPADDDDPADLAWLGMLIMLGSGAAVAALAGLLLWWVA